MTTGSAESFPPHGFNIVHDPAAFSNGDGTWTITNVEAAPFIGGDEWANGPGVRLVTGDFRRTSELGGVTGLAHDPVRSPTNRGTWTVTNGAAGPFIVGSGQRARRAVGHGRFQRQRSDRSLGYPFPSGRVLQRRRHLAHPNGEAAPFISGDRCAAPAC